MAFSSIDTATIRAACGAGASRISWGRVCTTQSIRPNARPVAPPHVESWYTRCSGYARKARSGSHARALHARFRSDVVTVSAYKTMSPIGTIGRYPVLGRMAVGGMGEIFVAHDAREDSTVVVKRVLSKMSSTADQAEA